MNCTTTIKKKIKGTTYFYIISYIELRNLKITRFTIGFTIFLN